MFKTTESRMYLGKTLGGLFLLEGLLTLIGLLTWAAHINPPQGTPKTTRPFISFWDWSMIIGNSIAGGAAIVIIVITLFGAWVQNAPGDGKKSVVDAVNRHA